MSHITPCERYFSMLWVFKEIAAHIWGGGGNDSDTSIEPAGNVISLA